MEMSSIIVIIKKKIFNSINEIVQKDFIGIIERKIKTNYEKNKK